MDAIGQVVMLPPEARGPPSAVNCGIASNSQLASGSRLKRSASHRASRLVALASVLLLLAPAVQALHYSELSADLLAKIAIKVATYNKKYAASDRRQFHVGLVYPKSDPLIESEVASIADALRAAGGADPESRQVEVEAFRYTGDAVLTRRLSLQPFDLLIVYGPFAQNLDEIKAVTRKHQVLSLGCTKNDVKRGLSVAVYMENQRPRIGINVTSAVAEGANFDSHFLSLTEIFR